LIVLGVLLTFVIVIITPLLNFLLGYVIGVILEYTIGHLLVSVLFLFGIVMPVTMIPAFIGTICLIAGIFGSSIRKVYNNITEDEEEYKK
jgi:hypothetical protein